MTACLKWIGPVNKQGYGVFEAPPRRRFYAHRLVWILTRGEIPEGLCVLHKCDNPPCINPTHLFLGTRGDNNRDRHAKGRDPSPFGRVRPTTRGDNHWTHKSPSTVKRGVDNPAARLSSEDVQTIRVKYAAGAKQVTLAKEYEVSYQLIHLIVRRKIWTHLP